MLVKVVHVAGGNLGFQDLLERMKACLSFLNDC